MHKTKLFSYRRKNQQTIHQAVTRPYKMSGNKILIWFSLTLFGGIGFGYMVGHYTENILDIVGVSKQSSKLDTSAIQEVYSTLKLNYDGTIDDKKLIDAASAAMVQSVGDQYTMYMDETTAKLFNDDLSGSVGSGIGVEMGIRNDKVTVLRVLADNPALRAGIQAGDVIVAVDGNSISGQSTEQVALKIRGQSGTTVKVTVERSGVSKDYTMTRETINNLSVDASIKDGIGILRIIRFDEQTGDLARQAAKDFKAKGVKGVVVDLRNNGGGYVSAAKDVASLWLDNQVIMTERTGDTITDTLKSGRNTVLSGVKTVVLVNGSSASASEIVAGALKDYGVATIVGEKSFGKGSVQKLFDIGTGAMLKVTIAKWYTPHGKNINGEGITPDVTVVYSSDEFNKGNDNQLQAAIAQLSK